MHTKSTDILPRESHFRVLVHFSGRLRLRTKAQKEVKLTCLEKGDSCKAGPATQRQSLEELQLAVEYSVQWLCSQLLDPVVVFRSCAQNVRARAVLDALNT